MLRRVFVQGQGAASDSGPEQIGGSPFRVFVHEGTRSVADDLSFETNPRLAAITRCKARGFGLKRAVVGKRSRVKLEVSSRRLRAVQSHSPTS